MIIAAPAPCTIRAVISQLMPGARAQAADAALNTARPLMNTRRWPTRSPRTEAVMSSTAKLRLYALTVHSRAATDAPRSTRIVFSAVVTTRMSSATIKDATDVSASTQRCREVMIPVSFR
jgi:hypothetical protein